MLACALLLSSCSSMLPWHNAPPADEVNLAFTVQNNLLFLTNATINGRSGRYFFGSAEPRSVVDPRLAAPSFKLQLGDRDTIPFTPVTLDLGVTGDAIIGADVWDSRAVTIDYLAGLLTYQKSGIHPDSMTLFRYESAPAIDVNVDGRTIAAIVDTALPDTLVLPVEDRRARPSGQPGRLSATGRESVDVVIAGTDFGNVDVKFANVAQPRIGNRLLSKFLISIDYGKREVGLWRDPRIP